MQSHTAEHHNLFTKTIFGFWVFLLTDCVFFAILFATYAVLRKSTFGGPGADQLLNVPHGLYQSLILLSCSYLFSPILHAAYERKRKELLFWLSSSLVLGVGFLSLLTQDYLHFATVGHDWTQSGFLSALYNLIFSFAFHIAAGLFWIVVMIVYTARRHITENPLRKLTCLKMFWQYLNILWVFIFTLIYLLGASYAP